MTSQIIPLVDITSRHLKTNARKALKDQQLRSNMRSAMDSLISKRIISMPDEEERENLRELGNKIKARALSQLPDLLEQLETNLTQQGIQVHWASTTEEANAIVLNIAQARNAKQVIKGKSMVSEEMAMNEYLTEHQIEALESDMGEYIIQLDNENPTHIIMPAIHKNAQQVGKLFEHRLALPYTDDVDSLIQFARGILREKFFNADIGIS